MACLTDAQIERLATGQCAESEAREFRSHADQCVACSERLAGRLPDHSSEALPSISGIDTARLESLLRGNMDAGEPFDLETEYGSTEAAPSIPGYEIIRKIHRGGQGVVYQAIQKATKRKVAVKVMREGPFASKKDIARFEREVEVLGQLNHPNLVVIHDSGMASGCFYYVMDYVPGQSLKDWMAAGERSIEECLHLFVKICEAANAAHLRGVIHRDLKPGNIQIDAEGQPHILDFGLAKVAGGTEASLMTITGQFVGTLRWASPEQAEEVPSKIDIRTDVYSLGVILYQMLTGQFPYDVIGNTRDVLDRVINAEPARPSTIRREINDEVETIVLKCLNKERERRYQTAGELARDIRHYLNGEAIEAKRDRILYILRKHLWRYRLPFAAAAGIALILAMGLFFSLALWRQARAEHQARVAHAAAALEQGTALHLAGRGQESRAAFVRARDALAELGASTLPAEVGLYRSLREFGDPVNTLGGHWDGLMAVAWLPNGINACSASEDGTARLWDVRTAREIRRFNGHSGAVSCLAVSPDGRYLLSGGEDHTVRLWDIETAREIRPPFEQTAQVRGVAFSPDGRCVLAAPAEPGGALRLWDIETGDLIRSFETPVKGAYAYYGVAFSADGRQLLATTYEGSVWIWDARTGQTPSELVGHTGYVISAAFSPDGDRVLSASFDGTLRLWNARTGEQIGRPFKGHTAGVRGVAFVGRGEQALSCSMDGSLKLWDVGTGEVVRTFAGHTEGVRGVAVTSDGRRAVSAGIDRTLRVWDLTQDADAPAAREGNTVTSLSCSADGRTFVSGDIAGSVRLHDLATFRVLRTFTGHRLPIDTTAILPDGLRLFAADSAGGFRIWDIRSGHERHSHPGQGPGEARYLRGGAWCFTAVARDGRFALSSRPDGTMDLRSIESGAVISTLPAGKHRITCVAVSPDCGHALCADDGGTLHYWDLGSGSRLLSMPVGPKPGAVDCVVFSADGRHAITGGHDLVVRLWDLTAGRQIREFVGPTLVVKGVGFGRSESTLFSVGGDQTLRMWDANSANELSLGTQFPMYCYALAVVPPGDAVLAGSGPSVNLWDVSRSLSHLEQAPRIESARSALGSNANDADALATLGEWYAFRGVYDWAIEILSQARANGADVSPLTMARCYWRIDRRDDAAREFRSALARGEAPPDYLNLCLDAVTASRAPTQPTAVSLRRTQGIGGTGTH